MASKSVDLSEFVGVRKGPSCSIALALAEVDASQREKLEAALASPIITGAAISRVINKWTAVKTRPAAVLRHRRGECLCD